GARGRVARVSRGTVAGPAAAGGGAGTGPATGTGLVTARPGPPGGSPAARSGPRGGSPAARSGLRGGSAPGSAGVGASDRARRATCGFGPEPLCDIGPASPPGSTPEDPAQATSPARNP